MVEVVDAAGDMRVITALGLEADAVGGWEGGEGAVERGSTWGYLCRALWMRGQEDIKGTQGGETVAHQRRGGCGGLHPQKPRWHWGWKAGNAGGMYIIAKAAVHARSGALCKRRVAARFAAPLSRPGNEAIPGGGTSYILRVCICMAAWRNLHLDVPSAFPSSGARS